MVVGTSHPASGALLGPLGRLGLVSPGSVLGKSIPVENSALFRWTGSSLGDLSSITARCVRLDPPCVANDHEPS